VQPVRSLAHSPLFQVDVYWLDRLDDGPPLPGLERGPLQLSPHVVSKFDMALLFTGLGERIEGVVEYATALFERGTVERYLAYFTRLLEGMVASTEGQAGRWCDSAGEAERRQVVHDWNQTEKELPEAGSVHDLFEEQVRRTPDAVAVEFGRGH